MLHMTPEKQQSQIVLNEGMNHYPDFSSPICMICVIPILIKNVSELCYALQLSSSDKTVSDSITEISFLQIWKQFIFNVRNFCDWGSWLYTSYRWIWTEPARRFERP